MTTDTRQRILPLTPTEQAMVYSVEHREHLNIGQILEYLQWNKARCCALEMLCQQEMPVGLVERE